MVVFGRRSGSRQGRTRPLHFTRPDAVDVRRGYQAGRGTILGLIGELGRGRGWSQHGVVVTAEALRLTHLHRVLEAERQRARHQGIRQVKRYVDGYQQHQPRGSHDVILAPFSEARKECAPVPVGDHALAPGDGRHAPADHPRPAAHHRRRVASRPDHCLTGTPAGLLRASRRRAEESIRPRHQDRHALHVRAGGPTLWEL